MPKKTQLIPSTPCNKTEPIIEYEYGAPHLTEVCLVRGCAKLLLVHFGPFWTPVPQTVTVWVYF